MENENSIISKGISRRDFVKASSLTAGGIVLSSLPVGASARVAGNDTLRVALVGCGGRGTGAAFNALRAGDGIKLVALADIFQDRLDDCYGKLSQEFGGSEKLDVPEDQRFVSFDGYRHATELADVVILATPPGFRPLHFAEAVNQGKHIFTEKPLATDAPGIRSILESGEIAQEKGLNVVVGLQRRYQDNYREILRRLHNHELGEIMAGQVYWNQGSLWVNERQPEQTELEYQMRNWYHFTWICGDHNVEQHIHNIDVANWFLGEYPSSAQGMGGREVRKGKEYPQIFDHHFVEYTYPSGVTVASQCRQIPGCYNRVAEDFQGTKGFVYTDGGNNAVIRDRNKNIRYEHDGEEDPNPYQQEHDELFASIKRGNVINDTEYAAKATMSAIMGRMATYSGKQIEWDEALNSEHKLVPDRVDWDTPPPVEPDEEGRYPIAVPGETEVL